MIEDDVIGSERLPLRIELEMTLLSWRSVVHVGSFSMCRKAATLWIMFSSDCWYCGASATTLFLLASAKYTITNSTKPMKMPSTTGIAM
mgnify:CR=1 FL=1